MSLVRPTTDNLPAAALSLYRQLSAQDYALPRPGEDSASLQRFSLAAFREMSARDVGGLPRPSEAEGGVLRFLQSAYRAEQETR